MNNASSLKASKYLKACEGKKRAQSVYVTPEIGMASVDRHRRQRAQGYQCGALWVDVCRGHFTKDSRISDACREDTTLVTAR